MPGQLGDVLECAVVGARGGEPVCDCGLSITSLECADAAGDRAALQDDPTEAQILRDQVASEVRRLQAKPAVQDDYDEAESILFQYLEVVSKWIQPRKSRQVAQVRATETL